MPGTTRILSLGIAAAEVEAVCRMLNIARKQHQDILWGVRVMAVAARPVLNED